MTPTLNQQVTHKSGGQKVGVVTAICQRSYGTNYGVTWDDLTERWHAADELTPFEKSERQLGIIPASELYADAVAERMADRARDPLLPKREQS